MPPEQRERIFARFQRAEAPVDVARAPRGEASRHVAMHGLGLGLYIAREIVEAHGGRLTVASAPGGGAAFEVDLPKSLPKGAPANRPDAFADRTS